MGRGAVHVFLDDRQYRVQGPMFIFTPPGLPQAFVTDADCEDRVLTVRQQLVWRLLEAQTAHLAQRLLRREAEQQLAGRELNLQALVRLILVAVLSLAGQHTADLPVYGEELGVFHRVNALIEDRYREHWSLAQYAAELGVSEARLNRICRRLSSKRLIFERLLLHSGLGISEIACGPGFKDPGYFPRFFTRQLGVTPSDYRAAGQPRTLRLMRLGVA